MRQIRVVMALAQRLIARALERALERPLAYSKLATILVLVRGAFRGA